MILKIFDLSHKLVPHEEEYLLELQEMSVSDLYPQYETLEGDWYIMQELRCNTHVGTHIESPYHHNSTGSTIADLPLDQLIGKCICLDFSNKGPGSCIGLDEIHERLGNIAIQDTILFLYTGRDIYYRITAEAHRRPYIAEDAVKWIAESGIKCLGIDCTGIEVPDVAGQPNHKTLFFHNIPLVENLVNLTSIIHGNNDVFILPLKIQGLESCPVRVIAINWDIE
jgi:arylformamidase